MHSHIFIPSTKKDICYCKACKKLSYKGITSQDFSFNFFKRFDIEPLKLKFKPITVVANYKSLEHIIQQTDDTAALPGLLRHFLLFRLRLKADTAGFQ